MIYVELLKLSIAIVLVVDVSGAVESLRGSLAKWLKVSTERVHLKPLDCSKCLTVWFGLAYALIAGELTLTVALYTLFLAVMTPNIATAVCLTIEVFRKLLDKIYNKLC